MGGNNPAEGRVEILHNGEWGTICDDGWDRSDATVICRMLGFLEYGVSSRGSAYFGAGTGEIVLDDVSCTGNESEIGECQYNAVGNHNCDHTEDAGVICQSEGRSRGMFFAAKT